MRKLGLIGGMSWISTRTYYEQINRLVQRELGQNASAPMVIESLDFRDVQSLAMDDDWTRVGGVLSEAAKRLQDAGAGQILITANVMHRIHDTIAAAVDIPVLHIGDCTAKVMKADGVKNAALLGMRSVMTESFFHDRLVDAGIELLPAKPNDVEELDRIITTELKLGKATRNAERFLKTIITVSEQEGAKAIVLACTELELVVDVNANVLPIYDTARIHCRAAADWVLETGE